MKTVSKILPLLLVLSLLVETGAAQAAAETGGPVSSGAYSLFAVRYLDEVRKTEDLGAESTIALHADGTGVLTMDGESMDIVSWSLDKETITAALTDGSSFSGTTLGEYLALDFYGGGAYIFYYAREDADRAAAFDGILAAIAADVPDSRLYAFWSGLDSEKGIHLAYDLHTEYLDATQRFDVHGKKDSFYSRRTTEVSGYSDTLVTFFRDGTAYTLYPDKMSGSIATTTSIAIKDILMMDSLYADIASYAREKSYTEEKRELEGQMYVAEVFPETSYTPEVAFYFDEEGQLVACVSAPPVIEMAAKIGESVYKIHAIDEQVDESLFDISAYSIFPEQERGAQTARSHAKA